MADNQNTDEINWNRVKATLLPTAYSLFEEIRAVAEPPSDDTANAITRSGKTKLAKFRRRFDELRESE